MQRRKTRTRAAILLLIVLGAAGWWVVQRPAEQLQPVGLFTSLPILFGEGAELGDLLRSDQPQHWAKAAIGQRGTIFPLDTLEALRPDLARLVIAQPRPLAPQENLALDNWVRGGGRVLLIADPILSRPSRWLVGDPRRPQDTVLLSPILARWGLELTFDEAQPDGPVERLVAGGPLTVIQHGVWRSRPGSQCVIEAGGLLAQCRVGKGRVVALADAEVLADQPDPQRQDALDRLLDLTFARP